MHENNAVIEQSTVEPSTVEPPVVDEAMVEGPKEKLYNVLNLERLEENFAKLARRAKKLGVEAPTYEVVGGIDEYEYSYRADDEGGFGWCYSWTRLAPDAPNPQSKRSYTGQVRTVHQVRLIGVKTVKLNGWAFAAMLDHELGEDNTIVRAVPGVVLPTEWHHRNNSCDHCKRSQVRKQTFVCMNESDGRLVQVGSTCIRDFLGTDVASCINEVELSASALACLSEAELEDWRGRRGTYTCTLVEFLAWTAKEIRENGWKSRGQAREETFSSGPATADAAFMTMCDYHDEQRRR